ncbi:hypothetical protein BVY04_02025 [bacterium M21]|nr:hypothetical protein BVY04_02025 [bacterium M21]
MAGIGFRIRKLIDKDDYASALRGYILGAFVSSGPFLTITLTIGVLTAVISQEVTGEALGVFRVTLVYVYALSLLSVGLLQMNVTRYVADLVYLEENEKILPTLFSSLVLFSVFNTCLGMFVFGYLVDLGLEYAIRATILMVLVANIWLLMIFITASRQYTVIAVGFVVGGIAAILIGQMLGKHAGLSGYLQGYAIGQGTIFIVLLAVMIRSFPCSSLFNWKVLHSYRLFPDLFILGVIINVGMWADKAVIWTSEMGAETAGFFRYFDPYDSSVFVAYLTTIPAMTYFLIQVETDIYVQYRHLFSLITSHHGLAEIEEAREELGAVMYRGFVTLIKIQFSITGACLLLATPLMKMFHMGSLQWGIFRISLIGSMLLVCMHLILTAMLYIEQRRQALIVAGTYLVGNFVFSLITVKLGFPYLGYGFTLAALIAFILGFFYIKRGIDDLLYVTLACQPIPEATVEDEDLVEKE